MTDEPENSLQNEAKRKREPNSGSFKPNDPRRWLKGRGKKSPEQREGEEILRAVIWKELNRPFDVSTLKPVGDDEAVITAIELMVRTWIKKRPEEIAQRIAGKVTERVDLSNSDGTLKPEKEVDDTRFNRAISSLADALRESVSGTGNKQNSDVDTTK